MATTESNFCFPLKRLDNSRLILEPFDFHKYADQFVQETKGHPELFAYVYQGPFLTIADFEDFYDTRIRSTDTETLFAILKKTENPDEGDGPLFAGVVGFQNASVFNATIEIGFVTIFPRYHRSFVASTAVGLLLLYALDLPPEGLGLRRCQWQSHALNEASKRLALRLGFTFESVQRFQRVVPANKIGNGYDTSYQTEEGREVPRPSRDSAVFAYYCDEWLDKRKDVVAILERR
ncbi:hypothetical protein H2200_008784 [Cladophialophora chaetospira]|uniref:N-acetyltransferase domain-containing protein n=1 Tax=Cladophialophora chaetospira TaxID=386627 RepID=A0AA39CG10_9EURO|nr:hypothetical protein H2200_008784 [Cladophialophora chaetospira]